MSTAPAPTPATAYVLARKGPDGRDQFVTVGGEPGQLQTWSADPWRAGAWRSLGEIRIWIDEALAAASRSDEARRLREAARQPRGVVPRRSRPEPSLRERVAAELATYSPRRLAIVDAGEPTPTPNPEGRP